MATNCAFRESVLLECDAVSPGDRFPTFQDNIMVLSSSAKTSKCQSSWTFQPLQDETTTLLQNIRYKLHSLKSCILEKTPQLYCHKHLINGNCALTTKRQQPLCTTDCQQANDWFKIHKSCWLNISIAL